VSTTKRDIIIPADDGYPLAATLFSPAQSTTAPITIIASATGVPRRYYAWFAEFLAASGRPALTFDYRGIGGSITGHAALSPARFRDWGILDIPGVIAWAHRAEPARAIHWVGHSYGGFGTGLAHNNHLVARHVGVATMSADIRLIKQPIERLKVWALLGVIGPASAHVLGYVPGRFNGNSADLPKGVALEWSRWCRTRNFLFGIDDMPERRYFAQQTSPMHFISVSDDPWVVRAGVEHLARQFTGARERSFAEISPADARVARIGHVGYFRAELAETAWPRLLAWLDGA
jgi:predicted alpha/beta hydrolase